MRKAGHKPRLVFASSIAVFGAPFPDAIGDEFFNTPLTSYGTQKNICELLISDYSRKGFVDGISIRLPTICVRPGKPNKAASGFFSNIMREPLAGAGGGAARVRERDALARLAARRRRLHAARREPSISAKARLAPGLTMPGLAVTVGEQIAALKKVAGDKVVARIRREPDPFIEDDRRRLAAQLRAQARAGAGLQGRRQLRGDHPHPHRGRARRQDRVTAATPVATVRLQAPKDRRSAAPRAAIASDACHRLARYGEAQQASRPRCRRCRMRMRALVSASHVDRAASGRHCCRAGWQPPSAARAAATGGYGYVTAESRYSGASVSGPVRRGPQGRLEVRLPGGTWIECGRSCSDTLRRETVDFWRNHGGAPARWRQRRPRLPPVQVLIAARAGVPEAAAGDYPGLRIRRARQPGGRADG